MGTDAQISIPMMMGFSAARFAFIVVVLTLVVAACATDTASEGPTAPPDLDRGRAVYETSCAQCHGPAADGSDTGPPLADDVYRSSHHADISFELAVKFGVLHHHWDFGAMPAVPGLSAQDIADVTAFVRDLQQQAGID